MSSSWLKVLIASTTGPPLQQRLAVARDQDRIDHHGRRGFASGLHDLESQSHRPKHVVARQHADLDRVGDEVQEEPPQLIQHHGGERRQHLVHLRGVLNRQGRHHTRAVHPEGAEDLQVELQARAPGRIRARDGEGGTHRPGW